MKFGKIYTEWIKYLKAKGLYAKFMVDYAQANERINYKESSYSHGVFYLDVNKLHDCGKCRYFSCKDYLLVDKGTTLTYNELRYAISRLSYEMPIRMNSTDWHKVVLEFGYTNNYIKRPRPRKPNTIYGDSENSWSITSQEPYVESASTNYRTVVTPQYATRHEEAHAGQWYDRFYNGGRNNNRNNIRWRR